MVAGGVASAVSLVTSLMFLVGSYGTAGGLTLEGLGIIAGPPLTFVAGIGILRRWRWARFYLIALLIAVLAHNAAEIIRGPTPQKNFTSAEGVPTTVLASGAHYSIPLIALCAALLVKLLSARVRSEFGASQGSGFFDAFKRKNWRVRHQGRDGVWYEEKHSGEWRQIDLNGVMIMGRAHHAIYFDSPEQWRGYQNWARGRRDEIVARIKRALPEPDYEHHDAGEEESPPPLPPPQLSATSHAASARPSAVGAVVASRRPDRDRVTPQQLAVVGVFIVIFLGLAAGMFWLVGDGLGKGVTRLPNKRASQSRGVSRDQEPVMFWFSISLYAAIGAGSSFAAVWFTSEGAKALRKFQTQSPATGDATPPNSRKPTAADLVPGSTYRVVIAFQDHGGVTHPIGETWRFLRQNFVPHGDGLTLFVEHDGREMQIPLQWRAEAQAAVIDGFAEYVSAV